MHFSMRMAGAPKVRKQASAGRRPGFCDKKDCSPERAAEVPPFQGLSLFVLTDPGRCPGLSNCAPSGLRMESHLECELELLTTDYFLLTTSY